ILAIFVVLQMKSAVFGNVIKLNKTDVVYEEGSNVTLSCSHSPAASDDLYWYRQYERSKPEFLVHTYGGAKEVKVSDIDPRFSVKYVDLKISSAAVSDSALYYSPPWIIFTISKANLSYLLIYLDFNIYRVMLHSLRNIFLFVLFAFGMDSFLIKLNIHLS
uniref:T-cell receptor alpha/delta variable 36.2.12 n=1 Tax=Cyprinus carpio carpio TaxID=630221 RepID=A0A9J8D9R3_CYPCA